ncbi:MAG: hypothetical protein BHV81_04780 [Butyricimonas synergistica]|nr:MAG: hypothetical protein BHV81_04780 [Butyricimonas synergistica]
MLYSPTVRIISNAAILMSSDGITFHNPLDSTFTIYYIIISLYWNIFDSKITIIYKANRSNFTIKKPATRMAGFL